MTEENRIKASCPAIIPISSEASLSCFVKSKNLEEYADKYGELNSKKAPPIQNKKELPKCIS
jgi:hypothetical protein